jgi:hypothetical protein
MAQAVVSVAEMGCSRVVGAVAGFVEDPFELAQFGGGDGAHQLLVGEQDRGLSAFE